MIMYNVDIVHTKGFGDHELRREENLNDHGVVGLVKSLMGKDNITIVIHSHVVEDDPDVPVGEDGCEVETLYEDDGSGCEVEIL